MLHDYESDTDVRQNRGNFMNQTFTHRQGMQFRQCLACRVPVERTNPQRFALSASPENTTQAVSALHP
jgi:hypothetical protein